MIKSTIWSGLSPFYTTSPHACSEINISIVSLHAGEVFDEHLLLLARLVEAFVGEGVEKRIERRVQVAQPDGEREDHVVDAILAYRHDQEHDEVGRKAQGEADYYRCQLL